MLTFSLLVLSSLSSVRSEGSACPGEDHPLVHSQYSYEASCSNQHIGEALRANVGCRLVETVVELPWPNNTLVQQMTPTHILVSRCAGSCHGQGQTCLPTEQSKRKVEVMLGKCGVSVGTCEKECAVVEVVDHLSCGCDCQLSSSSCMAGQVMRPEVCRCECVDQEARRQCQEEGRAWSEQSCSCGCPLSLISNCHPGYHYDYNNSCSCVPSLDSRTTNLIRQEDKEVVVELELFMGWEMILIIALGSLLIILSLIVVCLLIRLRSLRRKAECNTSLVPSTLSGQYFPCPDPCTDLSKQNNRSVSESGSERGKVTDSSLCSEERDCHWTDSSESLNNQRHCQDATKPCHPTSPCLESVHLNSNLAIRCNNDNYSIGNKNGDNAIYSSGSRSGDCNHSIYSGGKNDVYSTLGQRNGGNVNNSGYNTVKIVYTNGERFTELTCLMDPNNPDTSCTVNPQYNITSNPMNVYSM